MRRLFLLLFSVFTFIGTGLQAQYVESTRDYLFFEIKGHSGSHLYTGKDLEDVLENGYGAVEARFGWQSSNTEGWQGAFSYPSYGVGWYSGFIGNPDILGAPGALYSFISFPISKHRRHQWVVEQALGYSYDLKPYHSEDNVINDAIGSRFNVYFNLNIGANYRLNREMDLIYGFDLTHFSNGRMFKPNAGLNMLGINLGFRYHFNRQQNRIDNSEFPEQILNVRPQLQPRRPTKPIHKSSMAIYGAGGLVQNDEDMGTRKQYGTVTAMVEYLYRINEKSGIAVGLDGFYDPSLTVFFPDNEYYFFGFHGGYDLHFWKLSLRLQAGSYLHSRGFDYKGYFFFRPALKYQFMKRMYAQLGLKTQAGFKADWIELGIGVSLF